MKFKEIHGNKLINGDCLRVLDLMIEKNIQVDAIITDPPYNISRETNFSSMKGHRGTSMDFGEWDKEADILSYIDKLSLVLKPGANIVIFNDWKNIGIISNKLISNGFTPKRCLVLNKSNPAPFNRDRLFVNDVEFAVWAVNGRGWTFNRINEKYQKCIFPAKVQYKKYHPTMKDISVIDSLINILTNEGDTILDLFAGSFTTGVAAINNNRKFIGIELDEKYYNIGVNRIEEAIVKLGTTV